MHPYVRVDFVVSSICLALSNSQLNAQSTAADGNVRTNIQGIDIPAVVNAPFTAKIVVTWDQPLVGGGTISRTYYTLVARDSQGRVHRETRDFVPANSGVEPRLRNFAITDPVAGTRTVCTTTGMTCATAHYQPRVALTDQADGAFGSGSGNLKSETLGEQLIDSMRVVGTRETARLRRANVETAGWW